MSDRSATAKKYAVASDITQFTRGPMDGDRGCDASIGAGNSGFCECYVGTKAKVKVREVGCDHEPFTCAAVCAEQHAGRIVARGRPKEAGQRAAHAFFQSASECTSWHHCSEASQAETMS